MKNTLLIITLPIQNSTNIQQLCNLIETCFYKTIQIETYKNKIIIFIPGFAKATDIHNNIQIPLQNIQTFYTIYDTIAKFKHDFPNIIN